MNKVHRQVNQAIKLCLLLLCLGSSGLAQDIPVAPETLAEKRKILAHETDSLRRSLASAGRLSEEQVESLDREIAILEQTDLVYAQLESQKQRIEELKLARPRLQEELDRLRQSGPSEPERDTFSFLESVRIDLLRERARAAKAAAAQTVLESTLENARNVLEARQRERQGQGCSDGDLRAADGALAAEPDSRSGTSALRRYQWIRTPRLIAWARMSSFRVTS